MNSLHEKYPGFNKAFDTVSHGNWLAKLIRIGLVKNVVIRFRDVMLYKDRTLTFVFSTA